MKICIGNNEMNKDISDLKTFTMRMPKDLWMYLKNTAAAQEESMTDIIVRCVDKQKRRAENKNSEPK